MLIYLNPIKAHVKEIKQKFEYKHLASQTWLSLAEAWNTRALALVKRIVDAGTLCLVAVRTYINSVLWKNLSPPLPPPLAACFNVSPAKRFLFSTTERSKSYCIVKEKYFSTQSRLGFNILPGDIWHCAEENNASLGSLSNRAWKWTVCATNMANVINRNSMSDV